MDNFRKPYLDGYQNNRNSLPRNFNKQQSYLPQKARQSVPRDFGKISDHSDFSTPNRQYSGQNMMIQREIGQQTVLIDGVPHRIEFKPVDQSSYSYQARSTTPPLPENANSDHEVNQNIAKSWLKLSSTNPNKPVYNYFMVSDTESTTKRPPNFEKVKNLSGYEVFFNTDVTGKHVINRKLLSKSLKRIYHRMTKISKKTERDFFQFHQNALKGTERTYKARVYRNQHDASVYLRCMENLL